MTKITSGLCFSCHYHCPLHILWDPPKKQLNKPRRVGKELPKAVGDAPSSLREMLEPMAQGKVTRKDCIVLPGSDIERAEKRGRRETHRKKGTLWESSLDRLEKFGVKIFLRGPLLSGQLVHHKPSLKHTLWNRRESFVSENSWVCGVMGGDCVCKG